MSESYCYSWVILFSVIVLKHIWRLISLLFSPNCIKHGICITLLSNRANHSTALSVVSAVLFISRGNCFTLKPSKWTSLMKITFHATIKTCVSSWNSIGEPRGETCFGKLFDLMVSFLRHRVHKALIELCGNTTPLPCFPFSTHFSYCLPLYYHIKPYISHPPHSEFALFRGIAMEEVRVTSDSPKGHSPKTTLL